MASETPESDLDNDLSDDFHRKLAIARLRLSVRTRTEEILTSLGKELDENFDEQQPITGVIALERIKIEALAHVNALAEIHCRRSSTTNGAESHFWAVDEGYLRAAFNLILST